VAFTDATPPSVFPHMNSDIRRSTAVIKILNAKYEITLYEAGA
jgi:hypothetical protein